MAAILIICVLALVVVGVVVLRLASEASALKVTGQSLKNELAQFKEGSLDRLIKEKLDLLTQQAGRQLEERERVIKENNAELLNRQREAADTVARINKGMGEVEARLMNLAELQARVGELNDLLKPQQLRGELGEVIVRQLIVDKLPRAHYEEDYTFKDGKKVEFVIRLNDRLVPIDSKLQLEGFRRLKDASIDDRQRQAIRNEFKRSVKQKIDEVKQYIRPQEGTYNFAIMVIPSEAVFYELVASKEFVEEDGLDEYARLQNVCIASPNTFWAYVTSISQGLHGLEVERHAEEILSALQRISKDVRNFSQEEFRLLGTHLRNAAKQYDDAERKLREMRDGMASLERIEAKQFKGEGVAL